jgi:hypothetical protein
MPINTLPTIAASTTIAASACAPPACALTATPPSTCQNCTSFQNDPVHIEKAYPGLTAMSSGFASVRDRDGLCDYHQLYLSARDSCPHFSPRTAEHKAKSPRTAEL